MAVAVAVAVSGGVAVPVAVPVAGLTKRFFNQKDFLINVWGYLISSSSSQACDSSVSIACVSRGLDVISQGLKLASNHL